MIVTMVDGEEDYLAACRSLDAEDRDQVPSTGTPTGTRWHFFRQHCIGVSQARRKRPLDERSLSYLDGIILEALLIDLRCGSGSGCHQRYIAMLRWALAVRPSGDTEDVNDMFYGKHGLRGAADRGFRLQQERNYRLRNQSSLPEFAASTCSEVQKVAPLKISRTDTDRPPTSSSESDADCSMDFQFSRYAPVRVRSDSTQAKLSPIPSSSPVTSSVVWTPTRRNSSEPRRVQVLPLSECIDTS
jgi:hypothetical protein